MYSQKIPTSRLVLAVTIWKILRTNLWWKYISTTLLIGLNNAD